KLKRHSKLICFARSSEQMISPISVDEKYFCAQMSEAQRTQALRFKIGKRLTVLGYMNAQRWFREYGRGADRKLRRPPLHDREDFFLLWIRQRERHGLLDAITRLYRDGLRQ